MSCSIDSTQYLWGRCWKRPRRLLIPTPRFPWRAIRSFLVIKQDILHYNTRRTSSTGSITGKDFSDKHLQNLLRPPLTQISPMPSPTCYRPAWPQFGDRRGRKVPSASARRFGRSGALKCRKLAALRRPLDNTCSEGAGKIIRKSIRAPFPKLVLSGSLNGSIAAPS